MKNNPTKEWVDLFSIMLFGNANRNKRNDLKGAINHWTWNYRVKDRKMIFPFIYEEFEEFLAKNDGENKLELNNLTLEWIMINLSTKIILNVESPSTAIEMFLINLSKKEKNLFYINQIREVESKSFDKADVFDDKRMESIGFVARDYFKKMTAENDCSLFDNSKSHKNLIFAKNNIFFSLDAMTDYSDNFKNEFWKFFKKEGKETTIIRFYDGIQNQDKKTKVILGSKEATLKKMYSKLLKLSKQRGNLDLMKDVTFVKFTKIISSFKKFAKENYENSRIGLPWNVFYSRAPNLTTISMTRGLSSDVVDTSKMFSLAYIKKSKNGIVKKRKIYFMLPKNKYFKGISEYKKQRKKLKYLFGNIKSLHNNVYKNFSCDLNLFSYVSKESQDWQRKFATNSGTLSSALLHKRTQNNHFLKFDLSDYFDSIHHKKLENVLKILIEGLDLSEQKKRTTWESINYLLALYKQIKANTNQDKKLRFNGVHQGISSSGYFSNLYLVPFDLIFSRNNYISERKISEWFRVIKGNDLHTKVNNAISNIYKFKNEITYSRYSDDIVLSSKNKKALEEVFQWSRIILNEVFYVKINNKKTQEINIDKSGHVKIFDFSYVKGRYDYYLTHSRKSKFELRRLTSKSLDELSNSEKSRLQYLKYCNYIIGLEGESKNNAKNNVITHNNDLEVYNFFKKIFLNKIIELKKDNVSMTNQFKLRLMIEVKGYSEVIWLTMKRGGISEPIKFSFELGEERWDNSSKKKFWSCNYLSDKELIRNSSFTSEKFSKISIKVREGIEFREKSSFNKNIAKEFTFNCVNEISKGGHNIHNLILLLISETKWNDDFRINYKKLVGEAHSNRCDNSKFNAMFKEGNFIY